MFSIKQLVFCLSFCLRKLIFKKKYLWVFLSVTLAMPNLQAKASKAKGSKAEAKAKAKVVWVGIEGMVIKVVL